MRRKLGFDILALGLFLLLAVSMTYPLLTRITTHVPGMPGDNLECVWRLWWAKQAIVDSRTSPFFAPNIFYPFGFELSRGESTPAQTFLSIPLTMLMGSTVSYNVIILLSLILTGFGTYLLVRYLTGKGLAGVVAGTAFAFAPDRMADFYGHLAFLGIQWLPFLLLAFELALRRKRLRFMVLASIFYTLLALSSWYLAAYTASMIVLYLALRLRPWRVALRDRYYYQGGLLFASLTIILVLPFALPYLRLHAQGELTHYSFLDRNLWSASLADFFIPNAFHPLWGDEIVARFWTPEIPKGERMLYLGLVPLILASLALWKRRREPMVQTLAVMGGVAAILALGPSLYIGAERLRIPVPDGVMAMLYHLRITPLLSERTDPNLVAEMISQGYLFFPLPALLFRLFIPGFDAVRVWSRFGSFTLFSVAVLSGWGMVSLLESVSQKAGATCAYAYHLAITGLILSLILFDFLSLPLPMTATVGRPVDYWLAEKEGDFAIMEFPLQAAGGEDLYYTTIHGKKIAFGYVVFPPRSFLEHIPTLDSFPSPESLRLLSEWEVRYILLDGEAYGAELPSLLAQMEATGSLRFAGEMEGVYVYELCNSGEQHSCFTTSLVNKGLAI